jgi:hypothetical protein
MGVTWPGALQLRTIWTGNRDDPDHATFAALTEEVRARLGVPHPVGMHFEGLTRPGTGRIVTF